MTAAFLSVHRRATGSHSDRGKIQDHPTKGSSARPAEGQRHLERECNSSYYSHFHGVGTTGVYDHTVSSTSSDSSETLAAKTIGNRMMYGRDRWRHDLPPWFYSDIEKQQATIGSPPRHGLVWSGGDYRHEMGLQTYSEMYDDPSFYRSRWPPDLRSYRSSVVDYEGAEGAHTAPSSTLRRYSSAQRPSTARVDLSTTPSFGTLVGETGSLKSGQASDWSVPPSYRRSLHQGIPPHSQHASARA